jgi:hypothetical protein
MTFTPEESVKLLASLEPYIEPEEVSGFPIPPVREQLPELEREDWEFHRRWLLEAIEQGGTLYAWQQEQPKARFAGYLVVKDGKVLATMRTQVLLWD